MNWSSSFAAGSHSVADVHRLGIGATTTFVGEVDGTRFSASTVSRDLQLRFEFPGGQAHETTLHYADVRRDDMHAFVAAMISDRYADLVQCPEPPSIPPAALESGA